MGFGLSYNYKYDWSGSGNFVVRVPSDQLSSLVELIKDTIDLTIPSKLLRLYDRVIQEYNNPLYDNIPIKVSMTKGRGMYHVVFSPMNDEGRERISEINRVLRNATSIVLEPTQPKRNLQAILN